MRWNSIRENTPTLRGHWIGAECHSRKHLWPGGTLVWTFRLSIVDGLAFDLTAPGGEVADHWIKEILRGSRDFHLHHRPIKQSQDCTSDRRP